MTIRTKICCTTYKNICTYQKKAVPLQHEKVNKIFNIFCGCMAGCHNSHNINLLYSGKFTDVNLTQSKLAKSLHLKIGAKVIKKLNTNKLNFKIMANLASFCYKYKTKINGKSTKCRILIELQQKTPTSYQVITYIYEGINIVDVLGSGEHCYAYIKQCFFDSIKLENIHRLISEHHQ